MILLENKYSKSVSTPLTIRRRKIVINNLSQILQEVPYFFFKTALLQANEQNIVIIKSEINWQGKIINKELINPLKPLIIIINEQFSATK